MAANLKFAAIILTAGLVAAACSDSGGEPEPAATTTPPPPTATQPPPALTLPPPLEPTSGIDTSDWQTYESPLGFELQYPPDWTLDIVSDSQMRILDLTYKTALDDAIAAGQVNAGLPPIPGAAQFSVIADISPGFDAGQLIGSCGGDAVRATFLGRAAVHCRGTGTLTDTLTSAGHSYWVEFPPGHTMLVGGSVISEDVPDLAVVEAILNSFRFTPSP